LKIFVPRQSDALLDHGPQLGVRDAFALVLSPFTGELENESVSFDGQVLAP
jgi:hypothetical protein